MPLARVDFDNPGVRNATNPSAFGYHHGPIENVNAGWVPDRQRIARENGTRPPDVTAAENATAPVPGSRLSGVNGLVCDIDVNEGQMCGMVISNQPAFRRHIRNAHPGALSNPAMSNTSTDEMVAGQNALKSFVLSGGWRNARYVHEPGRGPIGGLLDTYATACEVIAVADTSFAAEFGTKFHRERLPATPSSGGKRKRGPTPPGDDSDDPPPTPTKGKKTRQSLRLKLSGPKDKGRARKGRAEVA